jgi:hypothetical protein
MDHWIVIGSGFGGSVAARDPVEDHSSQNPCNPRKPEAGLEPATYALQERLASPSVIIAATPAQ